MRAPGRGGGACARLRPATTLSFRMEHDEYETGEGPGLSAAATACQRAHPRVPQDVDLQAWPVVYLRMAINTLPEASVALDEGEEGVNFRVVRRPSIPSTRQLRARDRNEPWGRRRCGGRLVAEV